MGEVRIAHADCRVEMPRHAPFDLIIADPPYGDTSLSWDKHVDGWESVAHSCLSDSGSMWVFGSLRFFMATAMKFEKSGWKYAQELVWEKHNGSSFHTDRFKRVHELIVQFYRSSAPWGGVFNEIQFTADATARTVRRKQRPAHTGNIDGSHYVSHDGGPKMMRSVVFMRSMHGRAIHPTEKPSSLIEILVRTSCPPGGLVGDFFAGSGAVGIACKVSGRNYFGCELDEKMCAAANDRLGGHFDF